MVLYVVVAALAEAGIYAASAGQGKPRFCSYPPQAWCTLFSTSPRPSAGRSGGGCGVVLASPYARPFGVHIEYLGAC
jgi:hypothetical protein